ncbi:MAG: hypothetical protein QXS93_03445 [Candidatus Micrarchaeia archaeon]
MQRPQLSVALFMLLILTVAPVSAKLVSTAGSKNITTAEIHIEMLPEHKYNVTVIVYELTQYMASKEEIETAAASGGFVGSGAVMMPLAYAPVKLLVGNNIYAVGTTAADGKANFIVDTDPNKMTFDSRGCTEVYALYSGDQKHLPSQSKSEIICKDSSAIITPALIEITGIIKERERLQNACMLFFVLIGFLVAGLYASGKDPLRLLDITTPRLPGARRKPEIKVSFNEDKFKTLRATQLKMVEEFDNQIKTTAKTIARNASSVRNANGIARKREEQRIYDKIIDEISGIRDAYKKRLKEQTGGLPVKSAIMVDKKLFEGMYKDIANALVKNAYEHIKEPENKVRKQINTEWGENGRQQNTIKKIAEARHAADLISLTQRGPTSPVMKGLGYTGTISDIRRKAEATTGIGYAVRVVDNVRGYVNMAVQYGKYSSKYASTAVGYKLAKNAEEKARKELRSLQESYDRESEAFARKYRGLKPLAQYSDFEDIQKDAAGLNITVPIKDYHERQLKLEQIKQKIDQQKEEVEKLSKKTAEQWEKFEPVYYTGAQIPDIIKTDKVATMRVSALAKEVLNDINHRLFYELRQRGLMTEDEIDRFNGKLQGIPDIAKRREAIFDKFRELGKEDLYNAVMSEKLYVEVINYDDKERGFYKNDDNSGYYTLQQIAEIAEKNINSTSYESSALVIGAARAIAANPIKFEALVETQEQQLRRYIELDEFVKSDVIQVCVRSGMKKGIEYLMKTEKIEPAARIRETHAQYIGDEVLIELWGKRLSKKHERFRGRLKNISEEETAFLIYSEAFKRVLSYVNKKYAGGKISYSDRDINLVRLRYAREMAELEKRGIRDQEERQRREDKIRNAAINGIIDASKILVDQSDRDDIYNAFTTSEQIVADPQNVKKMLKDEALLEAAVIEWSALMALYRATGITGLTGLKQNIGDLANSAEWEQTCRKVLFERAREFNANKKHLLLRLNNELGNIVNSERAKTMDAEDLLLAIDKVANEVVYDSLMELFREVSREKGYENFYRTEMIRGKEHIFVKGFVDPTIEETPSLVTLYKKELPNMSERLMAIIKDELAKRGIQDPEKYAQNYANYHDTISYKYPMLHPGAYPLKDALHKYAWIQEIGNNYLACPKFAPDYETMGAPDKMVNAGVAEIETEIVEDNRKVKVKRKVVLPVQDTFARKAAAFLSTQANQFLTGGYIGTMAEAAATTVTYTRHGAFLKKLVQPYQGKEGFVKDVTRNEALAEKLLEAYKLRYLLEKRKSLKDTELEMVLKELSPDKIKDSILAELESIRAKKEREKVPEAANMDISQVDNLINERVAAMQNETDLRKFDEMDTYINELREYRDILKCIDTIKGISFVVTGADFGKDPKKALQDLNLNIEVEKEKLDKMIAQVKPYVGEYVMQELLNDLLVKSGSYAKEKGEELVYVTQEIEFVDRVAVDSLYTSITNEVSKAGLDKNEYAMLQPYLAPPKTAEELERNYEEIMKLLKKIREDRLNAVKDDVDALDMAGRTEAAVKKKYSRNIDKLIADTDSWKEGLRSLRSELIGLASTVPEGKRAIGIIDTTIASGNAEGACNELIKTLEEAKNKSGVSDSNAQKLDRLLGSVKNLVTKAQALDNSAAELDKSAKEIAARIAADPEFARALEIISRSPEAAISDMATGIRTVKDGRELSTAIDNIFAAIKNERSRLLQGVSLIEQQEEELIITTEDKIRALAERRRAMQKRKESIEANIHIYSAITPWYFWKATTIRYSSALLVRVWRYLKEKFTRQEIDRETRRRSYFSNGSLVQEVFEYSRLVKDRKGEMTEFENLMAQHARNLAYLTEKFLVRAFGMYASFEAGMHTRKKAYGLNFSGEAGYQFAGPLPSTLMQQITTYGRFGNAGWFTSMLLAYPIRKAQQTYARRYPLLKLISGIPAVYEPMKSSTSTFKGTVKGMMTAMLYMRYKDKYARMGEMIRSTAKDTAPRAFFPYLLTSNPYGEMRISELLELAGDGFRTSPRGPRDMLNYLLYKPNDIVVDFQDIIYSMKDGRSMKKTPEHLMDVGIYGVVGNSGFIAGREINFINTALGGPESMYQNRAFNMFNYNPQLSIPQMRYSAYGDMYKRMSKPIDIAEEMIHLTQASQRIAVEALIVPPLILATTYFGGYMANLMWNSHTMRAISNASGSGMALFFAGSIGAIGMIYRYEKLNSLKRIARIPYMSDEWKTYIKFSERMRNMHMGTYKSEVFYHE